MSRIITNDVLVDEKNDFLNYQLTKILTVRGGCSLCGLLRKLRTIPAR